MNGFSNWHQALLSQMAVKIPGVLPAVISEEIYDALNEYRGFRYVVRYVYTFRFDAAKLQQLVEKLPAVFAQAHSELLAFADFLKQQARLP